MGAMMVSDNPDDDLLTFEEESGADHADGQPVWRILIIDDEPSVHQATVLALKGILLEGRPLEFLHAYSASEARAVLAENPDLAVVLLDVVMESHDAGLQLIRFVREDLGNKALRVILRTGQPGYAPEIDTIRTYDINDYKTKSELTRIRLFTSLTVAIRSYWQIHCLEANRRGLELIVAASTELSRPRGLVRFAEGVVTQLCALLGVREEGIVCAAGGTINAEPFILAAAGCYSEWIGQTLQGVPENRVRTVLEKVLSDGRHYFGEATCLYFSVSEGLSMAAFVDVRHPLSELDHKLLEVFCSNISVAFENTHLLQRISELAYEDTLLKMPNRNRFLAHIDQRPASSDRLALVDLDGFADINSVLDQDFGDAVLQVVAHRLRFSFPDDVQIARVGSDVFGLLGPQSELNPGRIEAVFSTPFEVGDESFRLSATSGLVRLGNTAQKAVELLKNAGVALKQAKSFNRGKALYFEAALATAARERMHLLSQLRLAFSVERLYLVYQPFIDLATHRVVGAEALLRWRREDGHFVPPDQFIPLAEQSGLMVPIGDWVTRCALQFLKRLVDTGHCDFRMAINVSHIQFREPEYVQRLGELIHHVGVSPRNIEIELTESVAIDNIELIEKKLSEIRELGVSISIDDFGTGYSSLNILRQLPVDRLKIDRAFVSGKDGHNSDYTIASMVIQLAGQLGLETIAEGIETQEQLEHLTNLGCRDGQGYLFAMPMTSDDFTAFLSKQPA